MTDYYEQVSEAAAWLSARGVRDSEVAVVLGSGRRLFRDGSPPTRFQCQEAFVTRLLIATYTRPT